jgi:hypothetical protein
VQFVVLLVFFYVPGVIARRRFAGVPREYPHPVDRSPPWRVFLLSLALILPWGVATFFLSGAIDLGLFWLFALLWPWLETCEALLRRDIKRHGTSDWKPERPFCDGAIAVVGTTLAIATALLLDDTSPSEALIAGVACGLIVLAIGLFFTWFDRRSRQTDY